MTVVFHRFNNSEREGTVEHTFGEHIDRLASQVVHAGYHFVIDAGDRNFVRVGARQNPVETTMRHFCACRSGKSREVLRLMRRVILDAAHAISVAQPPPNVEGVWRAWNKTTDEPGMLYRALLNCPGAHPHVSWWVAELVSLRQLDGVISVQRAYADAQYELHVLALDPITQARVDVAAWRIQDAAVLLPPDISFQFHGIDEAQATDLMKKLLERAATGALSPERQYGEYWEKLTWGGIEHVTTGHPVGHA